MLCDKYKGHINNLGGIIMKKTFQMLVIVMALACVFALGAFASSYDSSAQELKTMGLFNGTDSGFDLDSAPTRVQASVMLVRLLGKESEANSQFSSGAISEQPFTDVPDWAAPDISWLKSQSLVFGVSEDLFGADDLCNAQMFCTLVLRSLGYSDGANGDFTYSNALDYAESLGVYNSTYLGGDTFLRDQAVAISYQALATNMKGSTTTLLDKLISDGAVSKENAQATLDKIAAYLSYCKVQSASAGIKAMDMTIAGTVKLSSADSASMNTTIDMNAAAKVIMNNDDFQVEENITSGTGTNAQNVKMWMKDGYLYMDTGTSKVKQALNSAMLDEMLAQETKSAGAPSVPLYLLNGITSSKTSGGTTYSLDLSNIFNAIDLSQFGLNSSTIPKMAMKNGSEQVTFKDDGKISSIKINCTLDMTINSNGTSAALSCDYDLTTTINATGSAVTITFPDFSGYTEQAAA